MDRQAWIAISLSIIGLVLCEFYLYTKYPPAPAAVASKTPAAVIASGQPTPAAANPAGTAAPLLTSGKPEVVTDRKAAPEPAAATDVPEQIETIKTPQLELHFTNLGGGIAEAVPLGHQNLAEDGVNIRLNHAGHIPIGALSTLPGQDERLAYTVQKDGNTVTCERTEPGGLKITKVFSLDYQDDPKQMPAVKLRVTFTNTGAAPYTNTGYYLYAGSAGPIHRRDIPTYTAFDWFSDGRYHTDHVTSFSASNMPLVGHAGRDVITNPFNKVAWVAVKNQFYATIVTPLPGGDKAETPATGIWARRFELPLTPDDVAQNFPPLDALDVALGLPALHLAPGQTSTQDFQIYAGPKVYSRLTSLGHEEQEVMDFGKFKIVSITLLSLMNLFRSWFGNYGVAIIVLTFLVKGVLFPLQNKANKSMKRMSVLQPKMTELREKFKEEPAKLNAETMKLYKEYGINPLGGCLPMLVQMPIFFGFLYMLYTSAELRNSAFLWVRDLSQPDTVAHLLGFPINVLPMLMIGTQFWQMSLTPRTGDPAQQKMMMFMPLVFGFFCYKFAAALALYYTMQGLLTIGQLYLTRNQAAPALVKVNPGPSRGSRPGGSGLKRPKL